MSDQVGIKKYQLLRFSMKHEQLKQGTFRWRKKFLHLPNRKQIIKELGIEWLANRLYGIIYKHISCGGNLHMLRVQEHEFVYIIQITTLYTKLEIIQRQKLQTYENNLGT